MKKGFTLIELLVVISIVGLLASIALASLNVARAKAADANVKQALSQIRAAAASYYQNNNDTYGSDVNSIDCLDLAGGNLFTASDIEALINSAVVSTGFSTGQMGYTSICTLAGDEWSVLVPLKHQVGYHWCVDSYGNSKAVPEDQTFIELVTAGVLNSCNNW
ncbi:MAG TPA: type II secretion system protein [Candidatus Nanoarchaeia archaeon]|nr:type II secretion system protein [Candidatus Nanoarchaeia archaeon]